MYGGAGPKLVGVLPFAKNSWKSLKRWTDRYRWPLFAFTGSVTLFGLLLWSAVSPMPLGVEAYAMLALSLFLAFAVFWQRQHYHKLKTLRTQLQNEMAFRRAVAQRLPVAWAVFDAETRMVDQVRVGQLLNVPVLGRLEDILAAFVPSDQAALRRAYAYLRQNGQEFSLTLTRMEGEQAIRAIGRRVPDGHGALFDALIFEDISADEQQRQKLAASLGQLERQAQEFRQSLDLIPFPLWLRNKDQKIIWCNYAYARAVDATPQMAKDQALELAETAHQSAARAMAERALSAPQNEFRHLVINGARRRLEVGEVPLPGGLGTMGFAQDVTAQEETASELSRHISAHAEVLEHLTPGIAIYGPDQKLKFFNSSYRRLWDSDENFLESEPSYSEILEDLRSRRKLPEQADFQRYKRERLALFTSLIEPAEEMLHLPDGTTLRMLIVPHPFGGLMFAHEDVTDRIALETSYNTLIAVQRETLDNLSEGIAVYGADGRLKLFNPAFARIWRLVPDDLDPAPHIGDVLDRMKPLFDYGEDWESFKSEMISYTLDRNARAGRLERSDGSVVEFAVVPLPDGAVLNSFLDVTDSARVEQALRASNAALATADRLKSEFVANVSYQLRTPLNTIMGFAEILTNQYFGTLNDKQQEYARTILEASKKLLLLINDVLDLATIEAGRLAINRRSVPVLSILEGARDMTAEWARRQQLEVLVDADGRLGNFEVDESRIKQSLYNLISNSIQYTPPGGRITLAARRDGDAVLLQVTDTGIGIPLADQERIFGKFERANPQARQAGAGLGLALVKSFIELHGGRISLESRINQGTTVTCALPISGPSTESLPKAS